MATKKRITKRLVESIRPSGQDVPEWDGELRGFGVRIKPSGVRSYLIQYRNRYGRPRRYTIGKHGTLTAEEARREARSLLAEVQKGSAPAASRAADQKAETSATFAQRYFKEYAPKTKKSSSIETDQINLRCHILPSLGSLAVAAVAHADVCRLYYRKRATPGAANRTLALLSHVLNKAEQEGLPIAGKLLGHSQAKTTHRYAHLADDPVKAANERVGAAIGPSDDNPSFGSFTVLVLLNLSFRHLRLYQDRSLIDVDRRCALADLEPLIAAVIRYAGRPT